MDAQTIKSLVAIFLAAILTENYILNKFLGICFLLPPGGFFVFGMLVALAGKLSKEGKAPETTGCGNCPLAASCSKVCEKDNGKEAAR